MKIAKVGTKYGRMVTEIGPTDCIDSASVLAAVQSLWGTAGRGRGLAEEIPRISVNADTRALCRPVH